MTERCDEGGRLITSITNHSKNKSSVELVHTRAGTTWVNSLSGTTLDNKPVGEECVHMSGLSNTHFTDMLPWGEKSCYHMFM